MKQKGCDDIPSSIDNPLDVWMRMNKRMIEGDGLSLEFDQNTSTSNIMHVTYVLFMGSVLWIGANVNTYTCVFIFVCALFVCPELVIEIQQLPHVFE